MFKKLFVLFALFYFVNGVEVSAYSVLTHEAIIDASWKNSIEPSLLKKYPNSTPEQLIEAHSYAYGGSIIPDIGYYPFGSKLFTNLVHNVRTGDFVTTLIQEASNLNEFAFALGAMAHYMSDNYGHSLGTNVAVPLTFPELKEKYGNVITYANHRKSHSRIEFGFDLVQTSRENYAPKAYHDFIGFNVSIPVMERAFFKTYGLKIDDVFGNMGVAIASFRWSVKTLLPTVVKAAWINKRSEIKKMNAGATSRNFSYRMKNRLYYHEFEQDHEKAGWGTKLVSFIIPILPKVGPLSKLKFKQLSPEAERLFIVSFETTLNHYALALNDVNFQHLDLQNRTLDTGNETLPGDYPIADTEYEEYLLLLKEKNFVNITAEIKSNLLTFYSKIKMATGKPDKKHKEIEEALGLLKNASVIEIKRASL